MVAVMTNDALPSTAQLRAARALVGWSQAELADRAGASRRAVIMAEEGTGGPRVCRAVRAALEAAGVEFLSPGEASASGGAGVRLRK